MPKPSINWAIFLPYCPKKNCPTSLYPAARSLLRLKAGLPQILKMIGNSERLISFKLNSETSDVVCVGSNHFAIRKYSCNKNPRKQKRLMTMRKKSIATWTLIHTLSGKVAKRLNKSQTWNYIALTLLTTFEVKVFIAFFGQFVLFFFFLKKSCSKIPNFGRKTFQ